MIRLENSDTWKEFVKFFREKKGYEDWTEEEIDLSRNDDDIEQFINWLVEEKKRVERKKK